METRNTSSANGVNSDATKASAKWFSDAAASMMEGYKKQLNLVSEWYSDFLRSSSANNPWGNNNNFKSMFFPFSGFGMNNNNNSFSSPFTNNFTNPFEGMMKKMAEYNQNMMDAFTKQIGNEKFDWEEFTKKYQSTLDKRYESSKEMMESLKEAYNKQAEFSLETGKKLQEDFSKQMDTMFKLNQQFWSDAFQKAESTATNATGNFSKDGVGHDTKKNSKSTVTY